ncbi:DUF4136 domain-containing protein [uncultured Umboniibacter sp.]|uniref:DUF4136 domain-containing protein n=1 Tax=uncultured Umboniibacter sp. TaxID=1798917 RepID=UPI00263578D7|nr:DUF4136 domain-containing protein [uncultured Umboniibacter sp.]
MTNRADNFFSSSLSKFSVKIVTLSATLLLAACASSPNMDYDPNYNFGASKTYQLTPSSALESTETAISSQLLNDRMVASIRAQLAAAGYSEQSEGASLQVTYHLESLAAFRGNSVGASTGLGWYDYHRYPIHHSPRLYSEQTTLQETDNDKVKVTIDFTDVTSEKLVWRTSSARRLLNQSSPERSQAAVDDAVQYLLKNLPQ